MKKLSYSILFILIFLFNPINLLSTDTDSESEKTENSEKVEINQNENATEIVGLVTADNATLYKETDTNSESVQTFSKGEILVLFETDNNWYTYVNQEDPSHILGYISEENIETIDQDSQSFLGVAKEETTNVYETANTSSEAIKSYSQGSILKFTSFSSEWYEATVWINGKKFTGYIHKNHVELPTEDSVSLSGVAIKAPTNVYNDASTSSATLKSYSQGSVLKYKTFTNNWYEATVYVNGDKKTGYIHKNHVEQPTDEPVSLSGVGLQSPTKVFSKASTSASTLKSYSQGSILKYRTFTNDWYEATVYVNGDKKTGYIHKSHVEQPTDEPVSLSGVALQSSTKVFSKASTSASALKSYSQGSILKYKTFTKNWYQATVYLDGEPRTGYIHKNHVEQPTDKPVSLSGVATQSSTKVYSKASTSASTLKSYKQGSILKYRTYINNWYQATVYINGKAQTGYIHKNHVEQPTSNPVTKNEIAIKKYTRVYDEATKQSNVLKSYQAGSLLKFETFINNWYKATVFVKGEKQTGYIHKNDVEAPVSEPKTLEGIAYKSTVNVYTKPNRDLGVRKSYREGSLLKYQSYLSNWYKATVIVNGKRQTGYIHKNDVMNPDKKQTTKHGIAIKPTTNVYAKTSTGSKKLKGYTLGSNLKFTTYTQNWYKATVIIDGESQTGYIYKRDVTDKFNAKSIVNPRQTYTYSEMVRDIKELEKTYPGLISTEVIGKSVHNRNIHLVKLGVGDTKITVNGSHHGREWMTTNLTMYQIDQYSQAFANNKSFKGQDVRDILSKATIYFVPMVNPDGVTLSQSGANGFSNKSALIRMNNGSSNFRAWKANGRGVDLNRQYPDGWRALDSSEKSPAYALYKGPSALSEPETQAMHRLAVNNNFESHVAYHSSGEIIYWSYNATGSQLNKNRQIANMISNKTGYRLVPPSPRASGSGYTDWVIGTLKKPGFTVEISPYVVERPVPLSYFNRIWNQNDTLPLLMAKEAYLRTSR